MAEGISEYVRDRTEVNKNLVPESEFTHLYKYTNKTSSLSQQERREFVLTEQKEKRHGVVDKNRDLREILLEEENVEITEDPENVEEMDYESSRQSKSSKQFCLMKSEFFTEIPDDLEDNWLVKFAPEGFRILIIAKNHHTVCFNEKGKVLTLKTHLPGGGLDSTTGMTVLDGIYNKITKTIFILDCLFWNTMSIIDSETTFRFYWLKNKFDENLKFSEANKSHKIQVLDFFLAQKPLIQDEMFKIMNVQGENVLYNGVVFYHKELHYTFGETPLLGWLFSYMLPEKLGIDILPENMAKMPKDYECLEGYLQDLEKKKNEKKNWRKNRREERRKMDTT